MTFIKLALSVPTHLNFLKVPQQLYLPNISLTIKTNYSKKT